jgi:alpha 1,3-glucosidase
LSVNIFSFNYKDKKINFLIRRQRKYQPNTSPYEVDLSSMKTIKNGHLQFVLLNTQKSHVKFRLDIFTLEHNSLRVKINERNPLRKRYEVEYSLVGEPKLVE